MSDTAPRLRGRAAPDYPSVTLPSGHTLQVRRLAAGTFAQIRAAAAQSLMADRPEPPTQYLEVAPGEWRDVPNPGHEDYVQALRAWNSQVSSAAGANILKLLESYAVLTSTDDDAVAAYRAAMEALGITVEESDRQIYCWMIAAPTQADQVALMNFIIGQSEPQPEAIQAQKDAFRGPVSTPPTA